MTHDEIEAAQVLSIYRELLRRRALVSALSGFVRPPELTARIGLGPEARAAPVQLDEIGLGVEDALVQIVNRASRLAADRIAAYRGLLKLYFTEDALRAIDADVGAALAAPYPRAGLCDAPRPDRQLADQPPGAGG